MACFLAARLGAWRHWLESIALCQVFASIRNANDSGDDVTDQCVACECFGCRRDRETQHCHAPIETLGTCEVKPLRLLNCSVEPRESRTGTGHRLNFL